MTTGTKGVVAVFVAVLFTATAAMAQRSLLFDEFGQIGGVEVSAESYCQGEGSQITLDAPNDEDTLCNSGSSSSFVFYFSDDDPTVRVLKDEYSSPVSVSGGMRVTLTSVITSQTTADVTVWVNSN